MKNKSVVLIDKHVLLTMITCIIIAITAFAFRYKNYKPYIPVVISVRDGKIITGEMVRVTAKTKGYSGEELLWDFGDNTTQKAIGSVITHIYTTPGKYEITLLIDGKNREYKTIDVLEPPPPPKPEPVKFIYPLTAKVGQLVTFEDTTKNGVSWEWRFEGNDKVNAITRMANYTFKSPGAKNVSLIVNGNLRGEATVLVSEKLVPVIIIKKVEPDIAEIPREPTLKEQRKAKFSKGSP